MSNEEIEYGLRQRAFAVGRMHDDAEPVVVQDELLQAALQYINELKQALAFMQETRFKTIENILWELYCTPMENREEKIKEFAKEFEMEL